MFFTNVCEIKLHAHLPMSPGTIPPDVAAGAVIHPAIGALGAAFSGTIRVVTPRVFRRRPQRSCKIVTQQLTQPRQLPIRHGLLWSVQVTFRLAVSCHASIL